jgi:hypothetical protein
VRDHYPSLGFAPAESRGSEEGRLEFELNLAAFEPHPTRIRVLERAYDAK